MKLCPQQVVDETVLGLVLLIHGLVLENMVVVPPLLDGEGTLLVRVDALWRTESSSQIQQWVCRSYLLLAVRHSRLLSLAFLSLFLGCSFAFDLLEFSQKLSSIILVVVFII